MKDSEGVRQKQTEVQGIGDQMVLQSAHFSTETSSTLSIKL